MSSVKTKILFLPGVQENMLAVDDSIFDDKFTEDLNVGPKITDVSVTYRSLPAKYTPDGWVKNTNLHCWNCSLQFANIPVFIPDSITEGKNGNEYERYGCFCSFNCAQKFINETMEHQQKDDKTRMLRTLYKDFTGKIVEIIIPSPSRTIMDRFCGEGGISPDDYKKKIDELNTDYELSTYKMSQLTRFSG